MGKERVKPQATKNRKFQIQGLSTFSPVTQCMSHTQPIHHIVIDRQNSFEGPGNRYTTTPPTLLKKIKKPFFNLVFYYLIHGNTPQIKNLTPVINTLFQNISYN